MRYIAQRRMKVGDRTTEPGEEVPEAATWPNVKAYIAGGHLAAIPDNEDLGDRVADLEAEIARLKAALGVSEEEEATDAPSGDEQTTTSDADDAAPDNADNESKASKGRKSKGN